METIIYRIIGLVMAGFSGLYQIGLIKIAGLEMPFAGMVFGAGIIIFFFPPSKEITIKTLLEIIKNKLSKKKPEAESETKI